MFIKKGKILILWGLIVGLMIIIVIQAFGSHGFVMVNESGALKPENKTTKNIAAKVGEKSNNEKTFDGKTIRVCIKGAVKKPGTVILPENSRLEDGIKEAGGLKSNAATKYLNLADFLEDGAFVYILNTVEEKKNTSIDSGDSSLPADKQKSGKVNINSATDKELDALPGVGESTAKKIIDYRKSKGKFKKIEDLKNVSGIGDAKFSSIKEFIKVR